MKAKYRANGQVTDYGLFSVADRSGYEFLEIDVSNVRRITIWWRATGNLAQDGDWIVQFSDAEGEQVGAGVYCYKKLYAIDEAKRLKAAMGAGKMGAVRIFVSKTKTNEHYKEVINLTPYKHRYNWRIYTHDEIGAPRYPRLNIRTAGQRLKLAIAETRVF